MTPSNVLLVLLHAAAAAAAVPLRLHTGTGSLAERLFTGLVLGQLGLIGIWVGFGGTTWIGKLMGATAAGTGIGAVLWFTRLGRMPIAHDIAYVTSLVTMHLCVVAVACLVSNGYWMKLTRAPTHSSNSSLRISLGQIILLPVYCGVVLAIGPAVAFARFTSIWWHFLHEAFLALAFAPVPIVTLWAALGSEPLPVRLTVGTIAVSGAGLLLVASVTIFDELMDVVAIFLLAGGLMFASLLVVRANGHRISYTSPRVGRVGRASA